MVMAVDQKLLGEVLLFEGLPPEQHALIAERSRLRVYKPETTIINQEETG